MNREKAIEILNAIIQEYDDDSWADLMFDHDLYVEDEEYCPSFNSFYTSLGITELIK